MVIGGRRPSELSQKSLASEAQNLAPRKSFAEAFSEGRSARAQLDISGDVRERLASVKENKFTQTFPKFVEFLCSTTFESFLGVFILSNCVLIGVEVHMCPPKISPRFKGDGGDSVDCPVDFLGVTEHFFTAFFLLEFILRVIVFGPEYYHPRKPDNFADGGLVWGTGVLPTWILSGDSSTRKFTALRACRLFKVARVVRTNPTFKEMWLLIKGLGDSGQTLMWTVVVMVFINYLFAVFGVLQFGDTDIFNGTDEDAARAYFNGLEEALYTLFQIVTADAWASGIARPIMKHIPWTWVYFCLYAGVGQIVLLNLITAVIVDNAMDTSRQDEETVLREMYAKRDAEFKNLSQIFKEMDEDGSGEIDAAEFRCAIARQEILAKFHLCGFHEDEEIRGLFDLLDDGDGSLTIDEFVDGLRAMQGEAKSKDVVILTKAVNRLHKEVNDITSSLERMSGKVSGAEGSMVTQTGSKASRKSMKKSTRDPDPQLPEENGGAVGGGRGGGGGGMSGAQLEALLDRVFAKDLENMKPHIAASFVSRQEANDLLSQQPAVNSEQPAARSQQPAASSQQPAAAPPINIDDGLESVEEASPASSPQPSGSPQRSSLSGSPQLLQVPGSDSNQAAGTTPQAAPKKRLLKAAAPKKTVPKPKADPG